MELQDCVSEDGHSLLDILVDALTACGDQIMEEDLLTFLALCQQLGDAFCAGHCAVGVVVDLGDAVADRSLEVLIGDTGTTVHNEGNVDLFLDQGDTVQIQLGSGEVHTVGGTEGHGLRRRPQRR